MKQKTNSVNQNLDLSCNNPEKMRIEYALFLRQGKCKEHRAPIRQKTPYYFRFLSVSLSVFHKQIDTTTYIF